MSDRSLRPSQPWFNEPRGLALQALVAFALLQAMPASAVLGGNLATVTAAQTRMQAARVTTAAAQGASVHDLRMANGSSIREYVNAAGIVYAVAWSTRLKPDYAALLGQYTADFEAGAASAAAAPGLKRSVAVDRGDLVVQSFGRLGSFVGKAWLKSQMPVGVGADAIR